MTAIRSELPANDPNRIAAEKLAASNGGVLGLNREQAEAVLAARGWTKPQESIAADAAANASDPAIAHLHAILKRDDLTPEWRAMVEKQIADSAVIRARHIEMKAGVKKP